MSADGPNKPLNVKVRSANLDAPTLVDHIGKDLLEHLCKCKKCSAVFTDQIESIGDAGCVEGMRLISHSQVEWEQRKSALALSHIAGETLDNYLFDRLTCDERDAVEHHANSCVQCANELFGRENLITCIKAAFCETNGDEKIASRPTGAVNVRFPARAVSTCVVHKKRQS